MEREKERRNEKYEILCKMHFKRRNTKERKKGKKKKKRNERKKNIDFYFTSLHSISFCNNIFVPFENYHVILLYIVKVNKQL